MNREKFASELTDLLKSYGYSEYLIVFGNGKNVQLISDCRYPTLSATRIKLFSDVVIEIIREMEKSGAGKIRENEIIFPKKKGG